MNKLTQLKKERRETEVISGNTLLFSIYFWLTKAFSLFQQRSPFLNKLIHSLVMFIPAPSFTIRNQSGVFQVQPFDDSLTISSSYFETHIRTWLAKPATAELFLDIGANRGTYTIEALQRYNYKRVHAFEPNPEVFAILHKNVALNKLSKKVACHNIGLGSTPASQTFSVDPMHKGGGRIAQDGSLTVTISTLDSVLSTSDKALVSFVKIDTEGYEFEVLIGMKATLAAMRPGSAMMIECTEPSVLKTKLEPFQFILTESSNHDHLFIKHA